MANSVFEVRVTGLVPAEDLLDLGVVMRATQDASTVLYGDIRDEAALFGLLNRLRDLGLEVVEVRRSPDLEPLTEPENPTPEEPE
ncbi:MAG: hypothetical protein ACXWXY_10445 [Aeromicrobium sp.]